MPKFPNPPSLAVLGAIRPDVRTLPRGTLLARIYFADGRHPTRWNEYRHYGPTGGRFDHHFEDAQGQPTVQARGVLYGATNANTCLAEIFQSTRHIDRIRNAPWLAIFVLEGEVRVLDLTGAYPTRAGASMAINSGSRLRARGWARVFYDAYPDLHGIYYASSMNGNEPALVLTDRAEAAALLPRHPELNRALADDSLLDTLKHGAAHLGYGLR